VKGSRRPRSCERGAAAIAVLLALVLLEVMLVAAVVAGSRHQDTTVSRVQSARAFYAAEAGLNMAIRELMLNTDEDGDGAIGSISDDSNDANDPAVSGASFSVSMAGVGTVITLTSVGRSDGVSRELTATLAQ
jgi:type II secretory pathway component PulK